MRRHAKALVATSALLLLTLAIGVTLASATAPTVTLEAATSVTYTSAQLNGKVDPKDKETTYRFQYTTEPSGTWKNVKTNPPLLAGSGEATVSNELKNLKPGTGYYVRLVAENADGQTTAGRATPLFSTVTVPVPTVSIQPPNPLTSTDATYHGEINPGGTDPVFDVKWKFVCTPSCVTFNQGSIAADNADHPVSVASRSNPASTPLKPNTTYEVSLVAENAGGKATAGPLSFTTPATAPQVLGTNAKALRDEATLNSRIQPGGLETTYHFEYGPTAAYGTSTPSKKIGGSDPVDVFADIAGLSLESTYHFRVVAENSLGAIEGPDRTFTTSGFPNSGACPNAAIRAAQGAGPIGDCRAFEKVSPDDKTGADVYIFATQSSVDGNGVAYQSSGAFAGAEGAGHADSYVSRRTPSGWTTEAVAPYQTPSAYGAFMSLNGFEMFSPDLSAGVLMSMHDPNLRSSEVDGDQRQLFLRRQGGSFVKLTPSSASPSIFMEDPLFVGASEDLSRVFFQSNQHLTPDAPPVWTDELYEWAGGEVKVVGVLPNDTVAPDGARAPSQDGNISGSERKWSVSADGSDVVFQSGSPEQIYLRSDGAMTTAVSLSQKSGSVGDPAPTGAHFLAGSRDASGGFAKLYFTSSSELTDESFTGPAQEGSDLYEYDVASGKLRDLTFTEDPENPIGARADSDWLRVSADGSYVYFVASGILAPGGRGNTENLYVLHNGEIEFVAVYDLGFGYKPMVSDNGKRALIFTGVPLTGQPIGDNPNDTQAFVYDQPSGTIVCASCQPVQDPIDTKPHGFITGYSYKSVYEQRNISADGSRVFFETAAALDPQDTNGQADVYEWENGAVKLISSGRGPEGAHFLDASASGDDVFVATGEQVLPTDRDLNLDVYDARANGGLPLPPTPAAPCEGDACQTPPSPPNDATPASAGFSGPGNAKPRFAKHRKKPKAKKRHRKSGKAKKRHGKRAHGKRGKARAKRRGQAKHRAHARHATRRHG